MLNAEIGAGAVDGSKIATGVVSGAKVLDESLIASDLATDSVSATEVADDSIGSGEISDNSLGRWNSAASPTAARCRRASCCTPSVSRAPGHVEASICNFSGGPMDPIVDLPVRVITIN